MSNILAPKRAGQKKVLAHKNMEKIEVDLKMKKKAKTKMLVSPDLEPGTSRV